MTTATAENQGYSIGFFILSDHDVAARQLAENIGFCQRHSARGLYFQIFWFIDELFHNLTSLCIRQNGSLFNLEGNNKGA